MSLSPAARERGMAAIARPSGAFAMVAMDQRESLRSMMVEVRGEPVPLEQRVAFKLAVARELSPYASALLIDAAEGFQPLLSSGSLAPGCGLILAADDLVQPMDEPVQDTRFDRTVDLADAARRGVVATKLLVIWRPDRPASDREALVSEFVTAAHAAGLVAIVEGIVRPPTDDPADREAAILAAAEELASYGTDLYKAQVPFDGRADAEAIRLRSAEITARADCPWVVLSAGVAIDDFPSAAVAACEGGASGFLAGRAMWRDAMADADGDLLRERSVPRLASLAARIDAVARPWWEVSPRG